MRKQENTLEVLYFVILQRFIPNTYRHLTEKLLVDAGPFTNVSTALVEPVLQLKDGIHHLPEARI